MARILIADGNTPEILERRAASGLPGVAEAYGAALRLFRPDLEIEVTRPYSPGWDSAKLSFDRIDGVAVTGSGVAWSASSAEARPFWQFYEKAFAAGLPALGCCWGMQTAAVVLGGSVGAGPNGIEAGFARSVALTAEGRDHPFHAGRAARFDVLCIHRDDVTTLPEGAILTASNAHTRIQAMVFETGGTCFWGTQYHPELTLGDIAHYFRESAGGFTGLDCAHRDTAAELEAVLADPAGNATLRQRHRIGDELIDRSRHAVELANWLDRMIPA